MALMRKLAPVTLTVAGVLTLAVGVVLAGIPAVLMTCGALIAAAGLFVDFEAGS
jgi:hypothetical protein